MARLQQRIKSAIRKRAKNPRPQAQSIAKLTATRGELDRFTDAHADILLVIESALVQAQHQIEDTDDRVVEQALRASIRSRPAHDLTAQLVVRLLQAVRQAHEISDELWTTGLRCIYSSVKRLSDCQPGDFDYLDHAESFVRSASRA